jgi:hypothetical protein
MRIMRYLRIAILASTASTADSQSAPEPPGKGIARQFAGDFDWGIQPEDGYPSIAFDDTNKDSEVIFKYNYTGTLNDRKFLGVKLYKNDCVPATDASLAFVSTSSGNELDIELGIVQETPVLPPSSDSASASTTTASTATESSNPSIITRPMSPSPSTSRPTSLSLKSAPTVLLPISLHTEQDGDY